MLHHEVNNDSPRTRCTSIDVGSTRFESPAPRARRTEQDSGRPRPRAGALRSAPRASTAMPRWWHSRSRDRTTDHEELRPSPPRPFPTDSGWVPGGVPSGQVPSSTCRCPKNDPEDELVTREALGDHKINAMHVVRDGVQTQDFLYRRGLHTDAPHPDLILLDLNLPGYDGR